MTNGWIDIKNTDMMLIMGGNPAENHPCGFKWPVEAKRQRNAKMIVVDPRFTRTAAVADLFVQIRSGTDIAFLGGLIRYAIENNRIAHDYLVHYSNAAFIIREGFKLPDDGLFSGFDAEKATYDKSTWNYEDAGHGQGTTGTLPASVAYDLTLQHPRSVFQLLKQHYSRYTPEMVERITGIPRAEVRRLEELRPWNAGNTFHHSKGGVPQGGGPLHQRPQQRRHEKGRYDYLCGGLDAARFRNTNHSHGGRAATAVGQPGTRRRRRQCAPGPFQYSRRDRYGGYFRFFARLSENACAGRRDLQGLPRSHDSDVIEAGALGFVQLLVEY